jgi:hypothetical protein
LLADNNESTDVSLRRDFLGYLAYKIGGGTDNMQKNAIAERILGLPREPRPMARSS